MSRPNPTTPSKGKGKAGVTVERGREIATELNRTYNLGMSLPAESMSPVAKEKRAEQDVDFRRHNNIVNNLRILHFKDKERLKATLDEFDVKAREQSNHWTRKLRARPNGPPRAYAAEDQVMLQELLVDVLTTATDSVRENLTQATRVGHDVAAAGTATQASVFDLDSSASPAADIDRVPVFPIASSTSSQPASGNSGAQALEKSFWNEQNRTKSTGTDSSSRSTAMFSALDSLEPFESQASASAHTEDAKYFGSGLPRPPSQESFAISDTSLDALEDSFNLYGDVARVGSAEGSEQSSIPEMADLQLSEYDTGNTTELPSYVPGLWDRLTSVFSSTPEWLQDAPFPLIWEIVRISLFCSVSLGDMSSEYSTLWHNQDVFRKALSSHPSFVGKPLPEPSSQLAWDVAFDQRTSRGKTELSPIFTATMDFNLGHTGPLYLLKLRPITLDYPHRLSRHFGADRFIEIHFPSHHSGLRAVPKVLRKNEDAVQEVNQWLTLQRHRFVGRNWVAFYIKDAGFKKPALSDERGLGEKVPSVLLKKAYLFAEDGFGLFPDGIVGRVEDSEWRFGHELQVHDMLEWLLQYNRFHENRTQPYLKLFSRIALGLSRTIPTVVFEPEQMRHHASDITAPATGKVMNDGIGRMSLSVARKVRFELGLSDLPAAVQGRLGCAKGMWILDPTDTGGEDWIETYPSQRKWKCDFVDPDHRTLEVRNYASAVRSAGLNQQLLPVLEDRAIDKSRMRTVIGDILRGNLYRDLATQRTALEHPLLFSAWVQENSRSRDERSAHCQVRFLGGLPDSDSEVVQFLLSGGFDPRVQKMIWDVAYKIQKAKCEKLKEKLNVRVGRTAYLHMVVDFLGVLEEGEVQVCFSSKFQVDADSEPDERGDDGSFSDSLLVGTDVLVARSPAHFASDVQRVRAVFRKELCVLKDVVIFSRKGDSPLADKLSGGDYDGDMAWVCWDGRIVENFSNAREPEKYDLVAMGYMQKNRTTLSELSAETGTGAGGKIGADEVEEMMERSFRFNMKENFLGRMTTYKENLCYWRGTISDETGVILSTLLGELVDQAKQGTEFDEKDFDRLRRERLRECKEKGALAQWLDKPLYKENGWPMGKSVREVNLIDHLKFFVAKPMIEQELRALDKFGESGNDGNGSMYWDEDLARPAKEFETLAQTSGTCRAILDGLKSDIDEVREAWVNGVSKWKSSKTKSMTTTEDMGYRQQVLEVYQQWCNIGVRLPKRRGGAGAADEEVIRAMLQEDYLTDGEHSRWAMLRASQAFRTFRGHGSKFVWQMAGRQLQAIKATMAYGGGSSGGGGDGTRCSNVMMTPLQYAATRSDGKTIRQMVARLRGMEEDAMEFRCDSFEDDV
ncbi:RNA-dependent RNA polymerase [Grosmannia clavigera kw1407]|uniref:RNA-dependent RNA polymerase n=1 Tax=Grosmannia clavigera (strain kw1407 / UAMH 11150) TaxID=655863 RepID=F0XPI9_GROCL|nr:RNA-dependent RNA polymerase [Grosmannia clavigera kw1407]EFX00422.1 RNA-dependent RNA polymerase [Grosmannia clavigera kw1407]